MKRVWAWCRSVALADLVATRTDPHAPDGAPLWVFDHGWHSGVVVERATLARQAGPVGQGGWLADFPEADWFEIGWGGTAGFITRPAGLPM